MTRPVVASQLLRRQDAADYLAISVRKLDELTRGGDLATVTIPSGTGKKGDRRWERDELNRFIRDNRAGRP